MARTTHIAKICLGCTPRRPFLILLRPIHIHYGRWIKKSQAWSLFRKKFGSPISDSMDRWSSRGGKSQRSERKRRSEKILVRQKGRKSKHCVFPMFWGPGGSKSRIAKAAGFEAIWRDERSNIARRYGAKHIFKSKCSKHLNLQLQSRIAQ